MKKIAIILALATALAGCAYEPKLTEQSHLYVDAWVKRNNPAVFVQPQNAPSRPFKAVVLPFKIQQDIPYGRDLSRQLTEVFWQTWSQDGVFPTLFYEPSMEGGTTEQAILVGRDRGADCVVVGRINYLLAGGTRSDSAVSLTFEIFDVSTSQRIWSMSHSGRIDIGKIDDFIFFKRETRMPQDPLWSIMTALAHDTGGPIKKWNGGINFHAAGAQLVPVSTPVEHAPTPPPRPPLQSSNLEK